MSEDFKESLVSCLAFHARDWSKDKRDAWIWGIIFGWKGEARDEIQEQFHWDDETMVRLDRLYQQFTECEVV